MKATLAFMINFHGATVISYLARRSFAPKSQILLHIPQTHGMKSTQVPHVKSSELRRVQSYETNFPNSVSISEVAHKSYRTRAFSLTEHTYEALCAKEQHQIRQTARGNVMNNPKYSLPKTNKTRKSNSSSTTPPKRSMLPIYSNLEESDRERSQSVVSRYFDSESDTSAKNACIAKMAKLERHKPSSYCFNEITAPINVPYMSKVDPSLGPLPLDSDNNPEEIAETRTKRGLIRPIYLLVAILMMWALFSVYFLVYGTSWSFNNFLKSLPDSKKKELAEELTLQYTSFNKGGIVTSINSHSDPILKGIVYNPAHSNPPNCQLSRSDIARDLEKLSIITTKIKTYGTQCNQVEYILDAIMEHDLNLTLSMGIWIDADLYSNSNQILDAKSILKNYGQSAIDSVFVGSDFLDNNGSDEMTLTQYISDMKSFIAEYELDIPVGTAISPEYLTSSLVDSCDIIGLNLQPFLWGVSPDEAAQWAIEKLRYSRKEFDNSFTKFMVSEIGWPYQGGNFKQATASPEDMQLFLGSWILKGNEIDYYYFEAFDEPWKKIFDTKENHWESFWGIFTFQRREKFSLSFPSHC